MTAERPAYDPENVFAKILRGEIPNSTVHEDEHSLAFNDIAPQAATHVLVIPKGAYVDFSDFAANASDAEIAAWVRAVAAVAEKTGVEAGGYRLIVNTGADGRQEVNHLHVHVMGGQDMKRMVNL